MLQRKHLLKVRPPKIDHSTVISASNDLIASYGVCSGILIGLVSILNFSISLKGAIIVFTFVIISTLYAIPATLLILLGFSKKFFFLTPRLPFSQLHSFWRLFNILLHLTGVASLIAIVIILGTAVVITKLLSSIATPTREGIHITPLPTLTPTSLATTMVLEEPSITPTVTVILMPITPSHPPPIVIFDTPVPTLTVTGTSRSNSTSILLPTASIIVTVESSPTSAPTPSLTVISPPPVTDPKSTDTPMPVATMSATASPIALPTTPTTLTVTPTSIVPAITPTSTDVPTSTPAFTPIPTSIFGLHVCAKNRPVLPGCPYQQVVAVQHHDRAILTISGSLFRDSGDNQLNEHIQILIDDQEIFASYDELGKGETELIDSLMVNLEAGGHTMVIRHGDDSKKPQSAGSIEVDIEMSFVPNGVGPTPPPTSIPSPTVEPTYTPSSTETVTPTAISTPTPTDAPPSTPTVTATSTLSSTPTATATFTPTPTATDTPLPENTPTATDTPVPTATDTTAPTPTATATDTPQPTATQTPTETPVPPTATDTPLPPTDTPTPVQPVELLSNPDTSHCQLEHPDLRAHQSTRPATRPKAKDRAVVGSLIGRFYWVT